MEYESPLQAPCEEPQIYFHALSSFLAPQTSKFIFYIEHYKVTVLITSGNTHNFIHMRVA
jgi:hypothetical protein